MGKKLLILICCAMCAVTPLFTVACTTTPSTSRSSKTTTSSFGASESQSGGSFSEQSATQSATVTSSISNVTESSLSSSEQTLSSGSSVSQSPSSTQSSSVSSSVSVSSSSSSYSSVFETDEDEPSVPNLGQFDDSVKYEYKDEYKTVNGGYTSVSGANSKTYTSTSSNALMTNTSVPFKYGTISADIKTTNTTDSGIVFNLTGNGTDSYWEDTGVSYYFFFLGKTGVYHLGKVSSGWKTLKEVAMGEEIKFDETYNLKVVLNGQKIKCFVNGELVISYLDTSPLTGGGYGLRTGASGIVFSNVTVTGDYLYGDSANDIGGGTNNDVSVKPNVPVVVENLNGYNVVNGKFEAYDGAISNTFISLNDTGMIVSSVQKIASGTISAKLNLMNTSSSGIVFNVVEKDGYYLQDGASYYFFYLSNQKAYLDKIDNGVRTNLAEQTCQYQSGEWVELKVTLDKQIKCYVNQTEVITFTDTTPIYGRYFGFRFSGRGDIVKDIYLSNVVEEKVYNTVSFAVNGANDIEDISVINGSEDTIELPTPFKYGYKFEGWSVNEDLSGDLLSGNYQPTADITLYAVYSEVYYLYLYYGEMGLEVKKLELAKDSVVDLSSVFTPEDITVRGAICPFLKWVDESTEENVSGTITLSEVVKDGAYSLLAVYDKSAIPVLNRITDNGNGTYKTTGNVVYSMVNVGENVESYFSMDLKFVAKGSSGGVGVAFRMAFSGSDYPLEEAGTSYLGAGFVRSNGSMQIYRVNNGFKHLTDSTVSLANMPKAWQDKYNNAQEGETITVNMGVYQTESYFQIYVDGYLAFTFNDGGTDHGGNVVNFADYGGTGYGVRSTVTGTEISNVQYVDNPENINIQTNNGQTTISIVTTANVVKGVQVAKLKED